MNIAYTHVLNKEPEARHVMCAFRLPGRNFHTLQDYMDDEEHGGGRAILRLLEKSDIKNCAVFVARVYHGEHIGKKRFEGIVSAAKSAISRSSYNEVTREHQFLWTMDEWQGGNRAQWSGGHGGRSWQGRGASRHERTITPTTGLREQQTWDADQLPQQDPTDWDERMDTQGTQEQPLGAATQEYSAT